MARVSRQVLFVVMQASGRPSCARLPRSPPRPHRSRLPSSRGSPLVVRGWIRAARRSRDPAHRRRGRADRLRDRLEDVTSRIPLGGSAELGNRSSGASAMFTAHVTPLRRASDTTRAKVSENNRLDEQGQVTVPVTRRTSRVHAVGLIRRSPLRYLLRYACATALRCAATMPRGEMKRMGRMTWQPGKGGLAARRRQPCRQMFRIPATVKDRPPLTLGNVFPTTCTSLPFVSPSVHSRTAT